MLKSFFYHSRIIRAHGWPIPFAMAAIGILGSYIGETNNVSARVGLMLVTVFTPFLTFAASSNSGSDPSQMLLKSLPMTRSEWLKGRYLFIYLAFSLSAFISLGIVKAVLHFDRMALGGSFNQNLAETFIIFWCGLILIHSIMLPLILYIFSFARFMIFFGSQVILMIYVASDSIYAVMRPDCMSVIVVLTLISIPLSYRLSVKNDPENREES